MKQHDLDDINLGGLDSLCPCGSGKIFTSAAAVDNPEWRSGRRRLKVTYPNDE